MLFKIPPVMTKTLSKKYFAIKLESHKDSELVQKIAYENGYRWHANSDMLDNIRHINRRYLVFCRTIKTIKYTDNPPSGIDIMSFAKVFIELHKQT